MDSASSWKSKYSDLFAEITWVINTWGLQWLWSWTRWKGMHILLISHSWYCLALLQIYMGIWENQNISQFIIFSGGYFCIESWIVCRSMYSAILTEIFSCHTFSSGMVRYAFSLIYSCRYWIRNKEISTWVQRTFPELELARIHWPHPYCHLDNKNAKPQPASQLLSQNPSLHVAHVLESCRYISIPGAMSDLEKPKSCAVKPCRL